MLKSSVVVGSRLNGTHNSGFFFSRSRISGSTAGWLRHAVSKLPSEFDAVHWRNTDRVSDVVRAKEWLEDFPQKRDDKTSRDLVLATDNPSESRALFESWGVKAEVIVPIGADRIAPAKGNKTIHYGWGGDEEERLQAIREMVFDMYALVRADNVLFGCQESSWIHLIPFLRAQSDLANKWFRVPLSVVK